MFLEQSQQQRGCPEPFEALQTSYPVLCSAVPAPRPGSREGAAGWHRSAACTPRPLLNQEPELTADVLHSECQGCQYKDLYPELPQELREDEREFSCWRGAGEWCSHSLGRRKSWEKSCWTSSRILLGKGIQAQVLSLTPCLTCFGCSGLFYMDLPCSPCPGTGMCYPAWGRPCLPRCCPHLSFSPGKNFFFVGDED